MNRLSTCAQAIKAMTLETMVEEQLLTALEWKHGRLSNLPRPYKAKCKTATRADQELSELQIYNRLKLERPQKNTQMAMARLVCDLFFHIPPTTPNPPPPPRSTTTRLLQ